MRSACVAPHCWSPDEEGLLPATVVFSASSVVSSPGGSARPCSGTLGSLSLSLSLACLLACLLGVWGQDPRPEGQPLHGPRLCLLATPFWSVASVFPPGKHS